MSSSFKLGDKFFLEIEDRQLDEYNNPIKNIISFIDKMKAILDIIPDEEIDVYNEMYNNYPTKDFIAWINQKYEQYLNK